MTNQSLTDLTRLSYSYAGNFASLLPLGVLTLSTFNGLPGPAPTAPDGWNWAPPLPWVSSRRGTLESELEFLSDNDFIRATYLKVDKGVTRVRIYVLPEDCEWYLIRESRREYRGRALLKKLWELVDTNSLSWKDECGDFQHASLVADDDVSLNLSTIFNTLPSPQPNTLLSDSAPPMIRELLESVLDDDGVPGFKSQLYHYQRESVWKMLQRELLPQKRQDPRLRKWIGPTGILSWINTDDMTFFRKQQYVDDIPGGILCEEMGTGKTCICLALIVLTIHQRALPPPGCKVSQSKPTSLYQVCFNTIIKEGIPFKHLDPRPHFYSDLENAMPFYLLKPPAPKRARRFEFTLPAETIYLSTSTLVVVPDTLIQQWSTEILKHVQDNVLSYTIISKPTQAIPSPKDLMKTDILLLSHSRFAKEDDDGRFEDPGICSLCRYYQRTECTCPETTKSPLLRVRWKRLIIDEGHVLGQGTTRLVSLAGRLRVERRWCVTGTVSNRMMGMDLGMERTLSGNPTNLESGMLTPPEDSFVSRKPEQLDLKRLGAILIDFLHSPPFYNTEIWNRYVVRPYTENLCGSMSSLRSIMTIMIRHRPKDIERDVRLPALHTKTVLLNPTPENRLSINVITALIASNAVLTQRCDQDYFFHSSQVKSRDEVVRNLMLAAFQFTGPSIQDVTGSLKRSERALAKAEENGYSVEDVKLLEQVVGSLKEAIEDEGWRTMVVKERLGKEDVSSQEMGYALEGCPGELQNAWALLPVENPLDPANTRNRSLFSGPGLLSMQSQFANLIVTPTENHVSYLSEVGHTQRRAAEALLEQARQAGLEKQSKKGGSPRKSSSTIEVLPPRRSDEEQKLRKVVQHELDHYDLSKPDSPRKRPKLAPQILTPPASPPSGLKSILKVSGPVPEDINEKSVLKKINIHRTSSAKLNYLLSKILELSKEEKIIVFSDYAPMMWYLGEALELLGIEHLIYIQRLMPQRRSQYIVTFNSSPHYRVLIMETKVAAHGLNVTAASRVFFLNVCWQRSVERQAIKRAHRIGQTREVFVETLVLKDTIEEELLKRREEMGREQLDRTKRFTDDGKLRGIISSAKFVPECPLEAKDVGFGQLFKARESKDEKVERELDVIDDERVVKKRRVTDNRTAVLGVRLEDDSNSKTPLETKKRKRSQIVVLKIPKESSKKRRRVQFADL